LKKTFTLTQLVSSVKSIIAKNYGQKFFWVSGELIKFNVKAGHYYLELADSVDGVNTAQMKGVIWKSQVEIIKTNVGSEFESLLQSGNRLLFQISVSFHEVYGLSLTINDIDPTFTYGEIELKKKLTIEKLKNEGLFDLQKKIKLPLIVKRIILIGSPETSGYRDFKTELQSNIIFRNFTVKEIHTSVQGDKAISEICQGLLLADEYDADAIVLIRGGGSKMDLNVFNDYEICKTISNLRLPLLTGIGHETDEVVADLVANLSQITPTAVAKFLYVKVGTFRADLKSNLDNVLKQSLSQFSASRELFNTTNKFLTHFFQTIINEYGVDLQNKLHRIQLNVNQLMNDQKSILELLLLKSMTSSINNIHIFKEIELPAYLDKIEALSIYYIELKQLDLTSIAEKIDFLNPLKLLKVGYTISSVDNIDVSKFTGELVGQEMNTLTSDLIINSVITQIKKY
jgi:exodeoxyribonuclease VII large subunit